MTPTGASIIGSVVPMLLSLESLTHHPEIPLADAEAIKHNYNTTGVAVMQAMYTDAYLSMGGPASTDNLAKAAGLAANMHVLDIGCGVGGPALHLAENYGCHVTGIDLVDTSIELAKDAANARGLGERTTFQVGDATALPFEAGEFDVVFGQDAWCHVPGLEALISEAARVIRPGGIIAFTDWLRLGDPEDTATQKALEAALSESAASQSEYLTLLATHGFEQIQVEDLSQVFTDQYISICTRLHARRAEVIAQFNERVFDIVADMNGTIRVGFETGKIGGAQFVGRRKA